MHNSVQVLDSGAAAIDAVRDLSQRGYTHDDIWVLAHKGDRFRSTVDLGRSSRLGVAAEGFFNCMARLDRYDGNQELHERLLELGMAADEAERFSRQGRGQLLIVASLA
ncbi:general stress protein [Paenibacillus sp. IB182496]|uniref:General stress protein n=1 Tax=Paenibacillus sabuli TaxID=2772509 RepID=A0A927BQJ3_9BACL|nr:general stress protein [Paenibacillus sabuli]MBD2843714.1 general stress protein [Paenibacillus sabuli]